MPINKFQSQVLKLLAVNRNPDSYLAGGIAINRKSDSMRFSKDMDIFHHTDESVEKSFRADEAVLLSSGYLIDIERKESGHIGAIISKGKSRLKLEWVRDSAFRFFPVLKDSLLGYRLHDIDLATNKCLALANRNEARDVLDLVQIHDTILSLTANVWAACGKDPGFSPGLMLNQLSRNARIYPEDLESEELAIKIDPRAIKLKWLAMLDTAKTQIDQLPPEDLGCVYLEAQQPVIIIDTTKISEYERHFGSVLGSWPKVVS